VPAPLHRRLFPASVIGGRRRRGKDQVTDDQGTDDQGTDDPAKTDRG
jgi:hypothetical protein